MSAYSEEMDLVDKYSYDKFIAKPFELNELIDSVNALVNQSYAKGMHFQYKTITPLLSARINT
jgi:DNA-binding response OmpR family regulator